ncbi:hypothetical protein QR680_000117 [Steinernema hermaphroditum]|uniref:C2 domain-containing protein n=1 Tax=Steinernema hermaphroditum TaxID=289476 RepID=A0AA39GUA4_9BILA|nr:hypothetical protein QR680_000117 [Steinernema hermaphroditum]
MSERVLGRYSEIEETALRMKPRKHRSHSTIAPPTSDSDNINTDSVTSMEIGSSESEVRELTRDEILHLKKLKLPEVRMALEFNKDEKKLNMYVKNVVKLPPFFYSPGTTCLISIIVIRNAARKWLGRRKSSVDMTKVAPENFTYLHTLSVPRNGAPVFNEFFSTDLTSSQYHSTMLKVQFRHKDRHDRETVIAEYDHWLDSHPIEKFTEFELPLFVLNPDLGSVEFSLCYLPTAERVSITIIRTVGLHVEGNSANCIVKVALIIRDRLRDRQKTKVLQGTSATYNHTMAFEVPRKELSTATLIVSVYQVNEVTMSKDEMDEVGLPSTSHITTQTR